jgi:hypothetical protein
MPGLGRKTFSAGEVLTAANVQGYLMDQTVMVFASSAARSSAIGTAVSEGMVSYLTDTNALTFYDGAAWVAVGQDTTLTNVLMVGQTREAHVTSATGFAGYTYNVKDDAVQFITANSTANGTVNFRGDGSTTLNSFMGIGETITCVLIVTNGATAYYPNAYQIDGTSVTPKWSGGTAPTAGSASSLDVYTYTILKTASATYTLLATQVKYA